MERFYRIGFTEGIDNFNITNYISVNSKHNIFQSYWSRNTNKRLFSKSSLHSLVSLDKLFSLKNSFDIEGSCKF